MAFVHRHYVFLVVAALGGMGWTLSASELWVASQRAMPDWARGRMNATMVMVAQAATALGGVIWGLAANNTGVVPTFLGDAGFALLTLIIVRVVPALQISIDFTKSVSFESAPMTIFSQSLDPGRLPAPKDGPVSITAEFQVDPTRRNECVELMRDARLIFLRNGAQQVAFVRGPEPTEQIPDGNSGTILEAAPTPTRADDKERKGCSPEASQSANRSKSTRRMGLTFCGEGSSHQES